MHQVANKKLLIIERMLADSFLKLPDVIEDPVDPIRSTELKDPAEVQNIPADLSSSGLSLNSTISCGLCTTFISDNTFKVALFNTNVFALVSLSLEMRKNVDVSADVYNAHNTFII